MHLHRPSRHPFLHFDNKTQGTGRALFPVRFTGKIKISSFFLVGAVAGGEKQPPILVRFDLLTSGSLDVIGRVNLGCCLALGATRNKMEKGHSPACVMDEVPGTVCSLWTCFMCSMSASLPRNNLWHSEQQVVFGPPIRAACCSGDNRNKFAKVINRTRVIDLHQSDKFSRNPIHLKRRQDAAPNKEQEKSCQSQWNGRQNLKSQNHVHLNKSASARHC